MTHFEEHVPFNLRKENRLMWENYDDEQRMQSIALVRKCCFVTDGQRNQSSYLYMKSTRALF
jgi:hypothetical protein